MTSPVEIISHDGLQLAFLIRADWMPESTTFITPDHFGQQVGMIVYGSGKSITPHVHLPIVRQVSGTTECIFVRKGSCRIDFYDRQKNYLEARELNCGDVVLLIDGGHGFHMKEDTVLLEVKQGPYSPEKDKEQFVPKNAMAS